MNPAVGDIVLVHTPFVLSKPGTWFGVLIRFGAWLRKDTRPYRHWNHAAVVLTSMGSLADPQARGVALTNLADYAPENYRVVHPYGYGQGEAHDAHQRATFAARQIGVPYGWLSIVWQAVLILLGGRLVVDVDRSWFCSELAAAALLRSDIDLGMAPARVTPAHLAAYFDVRP